MWLCGFKGFRGGQKASVFTVLQKLTQGAWRGYLSRFSPATYRLALFLASELPKESRVLDKSKLDKKLVADPVRVAFL